MASISKDRWLAIATLMPSIILIGIFVYGFIGNTFYVSMTDWNEEQALSFDPEINYTGLENYRYLFSDSLSPEVQEMLAQMQETMGDDFPDDISMFTDPLGTRFRQDMVNAVFYSVLLLAGAVGLGMFLAILLDRRPRGIGILRTVFLYPMALSFIVTGTIWNWLLAPQGLNQLPTAVGLDPIQFDWLSSRDQILTFNWQRLLPVLLYILAAVLIVWGLMRLRRKGAKALYHLLLPGVVIGASTWLFGGFLPDVLMMEEPHGFNLATLGIIMAAVWQYSGYTMALYLAGFHGISLDIAEAAKLDGAGPFGYYRHVAIPMLKPITISAVIILSHISLKMFDLIYAMTGWDTATTGHPALNMFTTSFRANNFAKGAAIAVVLFLLAAMFIIPYLVSSYRKKKGVA
ncbi:MAG: sugar ABC transporter permease [Desulfovibrio sp.]|nr:MAG: sugar ABC transporter permease [Desulfovibrio sp.]